MAAVPLDQDRALVGAFDDRARAGASRSETSRLTDRFMRRKRDAGIAIARDSTLSTIDSCSPSGVDQLVEHADEIVLRVVERLGRNRARVAEHVPGLLGHEPQRIAQDLGEIVPHQQRLVLVDRQAGVALAWRQRQPDAPLRDAVRAPPARRTLVDAQASGS